MVYTPVSPKTILFIKTLTAYMYINNKIKITEIILTKNIQFNHYQFQKNSENYVYQQVNFVSLLKIKVIVMYLYGKRYDL